MSTSLTTWIVIGPEKLPLEGRALATKHLQHLKNCTPVVRQAMLTLEDDTPTHEVEENVLLVLEDFFSMLPKRDCERLLEAWEELSVRESTQDVCERLEDLDINVFMDELQEFWPGNFSDANMRYLDETRVIVVAGDVCENDPDTWGFSILNDIRKYCIHDFFNMEY